MSRSGDFQVSVINKTKQWRGLATRYDKLAITYRAADVIFTILTWLRT